MHLFAQLEAARTGNNQDSRKLQDEITKAQSSIEVNITDCNLCEVVNNVAML